MRKLWRFLLMTAVGLVLVGFAGVVIWQQWPTQEQPGLAETAHKDQQKEVAPAPVPAPVPTRPGQGDTTPPSGSPSDSPSPPIAESINLLALENGGKVFKAPSEAWLRTIDNRERGSGFLFLDEEAVYPFKDGRPATFNAFEVLIYKKSPYNLNEFSLFYGNDHSHDNFKQIGKFQTENILYPDNLYQRFIFSAVTARYLKVKIISSHGDPKVIVNEFRLLGAFVE